MSDTNSTANVRWCLGPNPKSLDDASVEVIRQLFLDQTGERYASVSVTAWQNDSGLPFAQAIGHFLVSK